MSVSAAKSRLMQVKGALESGRVDDVERTIEAGLKFLEGLPDAEAAPVRAEFAKVKEQYDALPKPEDLRSVSAAQGKVKQAKSQMESNYTESSILETLQAAEAYLTSVPQALKAPVLAEIAAVRAAQAAKSGASKPAAAAPAASSSSSSSSPSPATASALSAARSRLNQVKTALESNRVDDVERTIEAGLKFLEGHPEGDVAQMRADFAKVKEQYDALPKPEDLRSVSAAQGKVKLAKSQMTESNYPADVVFETLLAAEHFLANVPQALKAPVLAEIATVRAAQTAKSGPPKATPTPGFFGVAGAASTSSSSAAAATATRSAPAAAAIPAPTSALSDDAAVAVSKAKTRIGQARNQIESRRTEATEPLLEEVLSLLAAVPADHAAPLKAQVEQLRGELKQTVFAEQFRRVDDEIQRHLRSAAQDLGYDNFHQCSKMFEILDRRVKDKDVNTTYTSEQLQAVLARLADLKKQMAAGRKRVALSNSLPLVQELEETYSKNAYKGDNDWNGYGVHSDMERFKSRIRGYLHDIPAEGDADLAAIADRIRAADAKIDAALLAWTAKKTETAINNDWGIVMNDIAGWEAEQLSADLRPLDTPNLPLTRNAMHRLGYVLADKRLEAKHAEAKTLRERAATKYCDAFDKSIKLAEQIKETPLSDRFLLQRASLMVHTIHHELDGTRSEAALAERAKRLDERWKQEVEAIMRARAELTEKLSTDANKAWPAIAEGISNARDFSRSLQSAGSVVRLNNVYNRIGWDWSSRAYDFATRVDGVILCGVFEQNINKEFDRIIYELKASVTDRYTWDVVGVVEGPGKVGERTEVIIRDSFTNFELGKKEEWPNVDCLRLRIIALHAGPIAIGPKS